MFNSTNAPFTMPVTPYDGARNDGFGDGNGWWIILFVLFFAFGGWGNGGWGGNGSNSSYYTDSALQRGFDTQNIVGKLDGINNGICSLGYDQLAQINGINQNVSNGFHGIDNAICNLGYQTQQGFNTTNVALMQGQNALQAQLADCCCQNREAISQVRFDMAQDTCALQNTMNTNTRDIIESQNAGTRAILDYLCQDKIATLQAENNGLRLAASQDRQNALLTTAMTAQTNQIIDAVRPTPVPSFPASNLYGYAYNNCGCNGCGC